MLLFFSFLFLANEIGYEGAKAFADALKVNESVTEIHLQAALQKTVKLCLVIMLVMLNIAKLESMKLKPLKKS